ncbi:MAG: Fic family protein [Candidatus Micrarchaeota archaeon]|nr:Fic family protein [Candidatus Micrarchaeota archaeon]
MYGIAIGNTETEARRIMNLSTEDIAIISKQCEIQHATSTQEIAAFSRAYAAAKVSSIPETEDDLLSLVLEFARIINQRNDEWGWRLIPVVFASGDSGLDYKLIPRAMQNWAEAVVENRLTPTEAYKIFEEIHPFEDGNGRTGYLIWAMLVRKETGKWPVTLPPDHLFSE